MRHNIKHKYSLIVFLVLFASTALSDWMVLPIAGYNSFAGFVYGVRIQLKEKIGLDDGTLQLVRSTKAMERMALSFSAQALGGSFSVLMEQMKLPKVSFFGYGTAFICLAVVESEYICQVTER